MKTLRRLAIFVLMVMPPAFSSSRVLAAGETGIPGTTEQILLLVGRSAVIHTDRSIQRVSLSTPEIADAMVTAPRELLVHGKAPGTISLLVWSDNGRITTYEVIVRRDLTPLEGQIRRQFPNEPIAVAVNGKDVVLSGVVSTKHVIDTARALAAGYVEKPENVVNMMRQTESPETNQVMLKVRFAEVNRSAMQELGINFFGGPTGDKGWQGRSTTGQFPAPSYDVDKQAWITSDFLNVFGFMSENAVGATVRALKGRGLFESLAEPNLVTQDGKEASFLAGGEFPYPVVQGGGANQSVTIVFKEYGVRLRFTPTITGGGFIHLKVVPEVSSLDFGNAVTLEGFRVPALKTRRTETDVELRDGQTFAISGLLDRNMDETLRRVPGIVDIPILGYLFRSQAYQKNNTELVVMITPHIVRRDSPGVTPNLPGLVEPFLPAPTRTIPMPPPAFSSMGPNSPAGPTRTVVSNTPAPVAPIASVASDAPVAPIAPVAPVAQAAPVTAAPVAERQMSSEDRKTAERAQKEIARLEREQAERARKAAVIEAERAAEEEKKQKKEDEIARKADAERQAREKKLEEKRLEEQAAIDRKRWLEQQEQAAKAKVVADKLAKEQARRDAEQQKIENARLEEERKIAEKHQKAQEKLAREQASRNDELEKLITQYKRLTGDKQ